MWTQWKPEMGGTMEHENMWRRENMRTCKDDRTRERVGTREQENMWRQRNQENVETWDTRTCGDKRT